MQIFASLEWLLPFVRGLISFKQRIGKRISPMIDQNFIILQWRILILSSLPDWYTVPFARPDLRIRIRHWILFSVGKVTGCSMFAQKRVIQKHDFMCAGLRRTTRHVCVAFTLNTKRKNWSFLKYSEIFCTVKVKSHVSHEGKWWSGSIAPCIHNFGSKWRSTARPGCLLPGKETQYLLHTRREWRWFQSRCRLFGEEKNFLIFRNLIHPPM
jgi:hypothetical protein